MEHVKQISLITTLYNEENNILNFLESYKNQTKYADEFIIVDGGSNDNTVGVIEKYATENSDLNIKVIVDKTCSKKYVKGPIAKGRNSAIEKTKYNYIAVTDAGCILDKNWFKEIVAPFNEDESVDVVGGWYKANINNKFQKEYSRIFMKKLSSINEKNFLPSSRSIAFKKECWQKVSGYPENTYTAEDTKFDINLKDKKCKFVFIKNAFVYWDCPASFIEAKNKHTMYSIGDGEQRILKFKYLRKFIILIFPLILFKNKIVNLKDFYLRYALNYHELKGYIRGLAS